MERKEYIFETRLGVRDYECDIRGIVNNTNYLHYTEHTRYKFLKSLDVSFSKLHGEGIDAVIIHMQLIYKVPFTCDDEITSRMPLKKNGLRWVFSRDLLHASDKRLCLHVDIDLVTLINGRSDNSKEYDEAFARVL